MRVDAVIHSWLRSQYDQLQMWSNKLFLAKILIKLITNTTRHNSQTPMINIRCYLSMFVQSEEPRWQHLSVWELRDPITFRRCRMRVWAQSWSSSPPHWGSLNRATRHLCCPHRLMAEILNDNVFKSYEYEARQSRPIHISLQNILLALWALCCCRRLLLTSIIRPWWAGFPGPN